MNERGNINYIPTPQCVKGGVYAFNVRGIITPVKVVCETLGINLATGKMIKLEHGARLRIR